MLDVVYEIYYVLSLAGNSLCDDILILSVLPALRNGDLYYLLSTCVDCIVVHLNDRITLTSVSSLCSSLHQLDCLLLRNDVCQFEECRLKYGVDTSAKSDLFTDLDTVDHIELDVVVSDEFLNLSRKMLLKAFHIPRAVQKECTAVYQLLYHVVLAYIGRVVACNEVCLVDQVGRLDRRLTKTKVRHGNTAGLLGVIIKVCLSIHICIITNDLDGVLVCTYSTVSAKSPELAVDGSFRSRNERCAQLQRKVCHIIVDTDCEFLLLSIVVYSYDLSRCGILGTKAVTSGEDRSIVEFCSLQSCYYVKVQRLAKSARLFCSVKNGDLLSGLRNCSYQSLCAKRSVKTNLYNTNLLACCHQVIDGLFNCITDRTHCDDNLLSISSSVVVEELVIGTDLSVYLIHVLLYDSRHSVIVRVDCFSCLEEDIRVLSRTSLTRMVRIQALISPCLDCIEICHFFQIFVIPCLNLLDLMRSTETVEEVDERKTSLDCGKMSNRSQVHYFLHAGLAEHACSGLTTGIYIGMISEDGKCMACKCTCGNVEYARKSLTCYFVEVRDHQKQTL